MVRLLLSSTNSTAARSPPPSSYSSSSSSDVAEPPHLVESDFVVILASLLCALICAVGLISVVRCACTRSGSNNNNNNGRLSSSGHQTVANRGLKKKVVQSLPKYTFDSSSIETENNPAGSDGENATTAADCAICLSDYVDGDEIRVLPQCGHRFHVQCIDLWLCSRSSCPSCRQILIVARCH